MKVAFDPNLLNELLDCAHNPPGGDPVLRAFYTSLVEMVEKGKPIAKILMEIRRKRPNITYKHLTNLTFRAYQAVKFREQDLFYNRFVKTVDNSTDEGEERLQSSAVSQAAEVYKDLTDIYKWQKELNLICSNTKTKKYFKLLLRTKSTTTTIYQRYAGPYAIISYLWNGKAVSIADLGCGGNYGLKGIELQEPFKSIKDLTPKKLVTQLLLQKINLKKALAIDKENPDEEDIKTWRMACSFYPQELSNLSVIQDFEDRIKGVQKVVFLKANLLTFKKLPKKSVDAVILSTTLYQLNLQEQLTILAQAKKLLKGNGLIIVQDFAVKSLANPTHLDFNESWFGNKFSYRTFIASQKINWEFLEVFQWNNGRCQVIKPGEDFNKFFLITTAKDQPKAARATFAQSTS